MNEKMQILKMLEEGKISADDAAKLLEAAGRASDSSKPSGARTSGGMGSGASSGMGYSDKKESFDSYKSTSYDSTSANNGRRPTGGGSSSRDTSGFDSFTEDLGRKFDTFKRDFEPKLSRFAEVITEKTLSAADALSRTISDATASRPVSGYGTEKPRGTGYSTHSSHSSQSSHSSHSGGSHSGSSSAGASGAGMTSKNIEIKVNSGNNELNLSGLNAPILLKGYNGDKISAKIIYKAKRAGAKIELMTLGNKYFLDYDEDDFQQVVIDAFIPEFMFYSIKASTSNGELTLSSISAEYIEVYNSNKKCSFDNIDCNYLKIDTDNPIELSIDKVTADNVKIECTNGSVTAYGLDAQNLMVSTFNGAISLNIAEFRKFNEYKWVAESSNQRLSLNLPTAPGLGYHIKASTSFGNVKVGLTGMNYLINEKNMVEAKSINYDSSSKQVHMMLETSNGNLTVN